MVGWLRRSEHHLTRWQSDVAVTEVGDGGIPVAFKCNGVAVDVEPGEVAAFNPVS